MTGEKDLATILASLSVSQRPGVFGFVCLGEPPTLGNGVEALVVEAEGVTAVATTDRIAAEGWESSFDAAWLTIDVQTSLEAVGLTAVLARVLGDAGISCNVVAAYHHDHLLVPVGRAVEAVAVIERLAEENQ